MSVPTIKRLKLKIVGADIKEGQQSTDFADALCTTQASTSMVSGRAPKWNSDFTLGLSRDPATASVRLSLIQSGWFSESVLGFADLLFHQLNIARGVPLAVVLTLSGNSKLHLELSTNDFSIEPQSSPAKSRLRVSGKFEISEPQSEQAPADENREDPDDWEVLPRDEDEASIDCRFEEMIASMEVSTEKAELMRKLPLRSKRILLDNNAIVLKDAASSNSIKNTPQYNVDILKVKHNLQDIIAVRVELSFQNADWIRTFLSLGGAASLLRLMNDVQSPKERADDDLHKLCEYTRCIRLLMRTESAFQHIFYDNSGAVKTMVLCLSISGELPDKTFGEVLQILAVMHMVPGGSETLLDELAKLPENKRLKSRFASLVSRIADYPVDIQAAILTLVNAIVNAPEDIRVRSILRKELLDLGFDQTLEKLKYHKVNDDKDFFDLDTQIKMFEDEKADDEESLELANGTGGRSELDELFEQVKRRVTVEGTSSQLKSTLEKFLGHQSGATNGGSSDRRPIDALTQPTESPIFFAPQVDEKDPKSVQVASGSFKELEFASGGVFPAVEGNSNGAGPHNSDSDTSLSEVRLPIPPSNSHGDNAANTPTEFPKPNDSIELSNQGSDAAEPNFPSASIQAAESFDAAMPPPPPPPVGAGGPPPPPPPGMRRGTDGTGGSSLQAPKVPEPSRKLKAFQWSKLPANQASKTIFSDILKTDTTMDRLVDFKALEESFGAVKAKEFMTASSTGEAASTKRGPVTKLDSKLSQNLSIFLSKFKKNDHAELIQALMNFDSIMLDSNAIFQLQGFIPTKDNLSGIQQFFDEGGAREELADADLFLLELAKVSFLSLRLKAFELMQQFELKYHESKQDIRYVLNACDQLNTNSSIKHILRVVLSMGNFLNANTNRGAAVGFRIGSLNQLSQVKGTNNVTLLHCVVDSIDDSQFEEFSKLEAVQLACKVSVDSLRTEIASLAKLFAEVDQGRFKLDPTDPSRSKIDSFLREEYPKLIELQDSHKQLESSVKSVIAFYGEDPVTMKPEEFFETFGAFFSSVQQVLKAKEKERLVAENLAKRAALRTQPAKVSKSSSSSTLNSVTKNSRDLVDELFAQMNAGRVFRERNNPANS